MSVWLGHPNPEALICGRALGIVGAITGCPNDTLTEREPHGR